ncbi:CPBP family intramembrane glutamic endopeptidase [Bacillus sp. B1-b2]|uniref:CPBP family intramembrane glutamic endopeptidase n=1 Tax=Bacillus sp. B1-b2 TaxID=2653201 RepID=UPI0012628747|nr:CPBP family intramembrane glutamic endopeptidase [Bacillus sp. B1-b2]KAB7672905.1 CPBP family intramembrane metalloprotease [Bacillus sp. B1-b2]
MNKENYSKLINQLSDRDLVKNLYATQAILLFICLVLQFLIFHDEETFYQMFHYDLVDFFIGIMAGFIIVGLDVIFMVKLPQQYHDDGGVNKRVFQNRNPLHIAFIAFVVAFVEEILFRGVIQSNLGIWISCLIFALMHYRYLFNLFLFFNVVLVSVVISLLFEWTENLWVTVIMHFLIDFILGCILRYRLFDKREK